MTPETPSPRSVKTPLPPLGAVPAKRRGECRQQHQRQHHREILDDQPANRDAPFPGLDQPPLLHRAQEHHGGRDGECKAEDESRPGRPAEEPGEPHAEQRCAGDLDHGARQGDRTHGHEIRKREVQADAEHQEDHADFGEFRRNP